MAGPGLVRASPLDELPAIQALGRDERPGILAADRERVGAGRDLQHLGQFRVQRAARRRECQVAQSGGRRLHRRRSRAEFQLHRPAAAGDGLHHRHPSREPQPASLDKALFEASTDRADFVSRLFSRPRPTDLGPTASVEEIFSRYAAVPASRELFSRNADRVRERLLKTHSLPLSQTDLAWIDRAFGAFYADGPEIQFWGSRAVDALRPSYRQLMTTQDFTGQSRSFLASEEEFRFVKSLHSRNLIVPVVGDFGGPAAVRRVGEYVRTHADVVSAFYGSNVGVYLNTEQTRAFCKNLAGLPAASGAWFIERDSVRPLTAKLRSCAPDAKQSNER